MKDCEKINEFLTTLFNYMDLDVKINCEEKEEKLIVNLDSENSSNLIGYRGEMLDSIQSLCGALVNKEKDEYKRVVINCEGYREKRQEILESLAKKSAVKAIKSRRKVSLNPMNSFERRIIHAALADFANIKTESQGVEPNRYVVIIPDKQDNRKSSGFKSELISTNKKPSGFGTYLGNSLKK